MMLKQQISFDHIILRTYNQQGISNHFPLVIESKNSKFYNRFMMEMMNTELSTVLHINISDINKIDQKLDRWNIYLLKLRNQFREDIDQIYERFGGQLQVWHQLTMQAVINDEFEMEKWFEQFSILEENKFNNVKIMTVINNQINIQLDNNHIDANIYRMMNALDHFNGKMFTGTYYADMLLIESPIIHSLQQVNVLYHPKDLCNLYFTYKYYNMFCGQYLERRNSRKQNKFIINIILGQGRQGYRFVSFSLQIGKKEKRRIFSTSY